MCGKRVCQSLVRSARGRRVRCQDRVEVIVDPRAPDGQHLPFAALARQARFFQHPGRGRVFHGAPGFEAVQAQAVEPEAHQRAQGLRGQPLALVRGHQLVPDLPVVEGGLAQGQGN